METQGLVRRVKKLLLRVHAAKKWQKQDLLLRSFNSKFYAFQLYHEEENGLK